MAMEVAAVSRGWRRMEIETVMPAEVTAVRAERSVVTVDGRW